MRLYKVLLYQSPESTQLGKNSTVALMYIVVYFRRNKQKTLYTTQINHQAKSLQSLILSLLDSCSQLQAAQDSCQERLPRAAILQRSYDRTSMRAVPKEDHSSAFLLFLLAANFRNVTCYYGMAQYAESDITP